MVSLTITTAFRSDIRLFLKSNTVLVYRADLKTLTCPSFSRAIPEFPYSSTRVPAIMVSPPLQGGEMRFLSLQKITGVKPTPMSTHFGHVCLLILWSTIPNGPRGG